MTEPKTTSEPAEDEISLLDLMVIIAENWLLLVLVPLALAAVAYGVLVTRPQPYVSDMVVALPPADVAEFVEAGIADGALAAELALAGPDRERIALTPGENPLETRITVLSDQRSAGREALGQLSDLLEAAVQAGTITTASGDLLTRVVDLQATMEIRDAAIDRLGDILARTTRVTEDAQTYALSALAFNQMVLGRAEDEAALLDLKDQFAASSAEIVLAAPSAPRPQGRSPLLIAVLAGLGSAFMLLIFVFIRAGLRSAASEEVNREKLERIRNGLLLRRSR